MTVFDRIYIIIQYVQHFIFKVLVKKLEDFLEQFYRRTDSATLIPVILFNKLYL